jgi:hypothetical protein
MVEYRYLAPDTHVRIVVEQPMNLNQKQLAAAISARRSWGAFYLCTPSDSPSWGYYADVHNENVKRRRAQRQSFELDRRVMVRKLSQTTSEAQRELVERLKADYNDE